MQFSVCFLLLGLLIALSIRGGAFAEGMREFADYPVVIFVLILVRRLPGFLCAGPTQDLASF
jgi:hypothetical protein